VLTARRLVSGRFMPICHGGHQYVPPCALEQSSSCSRSRLSLEVHFVHQRASVREGNNSEVVAMKKLGISILSMVNLFCGAGYLHAQ
jgi:hypothetical protein